MMSSFKSWHLFTFSMAGPDKTPCDIAARMLAALAFFKADTASIKELPVAIKSSTIKTSLPSTSPKICITSACSGEMRRLSIMAKPADNRLA